MQCVPDVGAQQRRQAPHVRRASPCRQCGNLRRLQRGFPDGKIIDSPAVTQGACRVHGAEEQAAQNRLIRCIDRFVKQSAVLPDLLGVAVFEKYVMVPLASPLGGIGFVYLNAGGAGVAAAGGVKINGRIRPWQVRVKDALAASSRAAGAVKNSIVLRQGSRSQRPYRNREGVAHGHGVKAAGRGGRK